MPEDRSILRRPAPSPDGAWAYGPDADDVADIYLPSAAVTGPAVVLLHGGFWRPDYDRTHLRATAAALAAHGRLVVLAEYPRIPGSPDRTVDGVRQVLRALPQWLAARPAPGAGGAVLMGHSAGGHLALLAATWPDTVATSCLALAPVAGLAAADRLGLDAGAVRAFLGGPASDRPDLDTSVLPPPAVPVTVVHGVEDTVVPVALSVDYSRRTGARLVTPADCAHFEVIDPLSPAWPVVLRELDALGAPAGIE